MATRRNRPWLVHRRRRRIDPKHGQPWEARRVVVLPAWQPDTGENDIGPFKTKTAALKEVQRLSAAKDLAAQK